MGVSLASNPHQAPHVTQVALWPCEMVSDFNQWYFMRDTKRIVRVGIWIEECLGVKSGQVVACQCAKFPGSGCSSKEIHWQWGKSGKLRHKSAGTCLMAPTRGGNRLTMGSCDDVGVTAWSFKERV